MSMPHYIPMTEPPHDEHCPFGQYGNSQPCYCPWLKMARRSERARLRQEVVAVPFLPGVADVYVRLSEVLAVFDDKA